MTLPFWLQYILLALMVVGALIYLIAPYFRKKDSKYKGSDACCGCSLSDACKSKKHDKRKICDKDLQDS